MTEETRADQREEQRQAKPCLLGGILAGLIAGLLSGAAAAGRSVAAGDGPGLPARLVAAPWIPWIGQGAWSDGTLPVVLGISVHLVVSMFLGAVFSVFVRTRTSLPSAAAAGLAYGAGVWLVRTHLVLPLANPNLLEFARQYPGWWFSDHLVFGATLLLTPALARRLEGSRNRSRPPGGGAAAG